MRYGGGRRLRCGRSHSKGLCRLDIFASQPNSSSVCSLTAGSIWLRYVYDDDEANMYVHHDVGLDAYPLCVDWCAIRICKSCIGMREHLVIQLMISLSIIVCSHARILSF